MSNLLDDKLTNLSHFGKYISNTSIHFLGSNSPQIIKYPIIDTDLNNWYDITTGIFNPKEQGIYLITASIAAIQIGYTVLSLYKNNELFANVHEPDTSFLTRIKLITSVELNGTTDFIDIRCEAEINNNVNQNPSSSFISIVKF